MRLHEARCRGQWELFDSTSLADHAAARDLCATCPVLASCAGLLRQVQEKTAGVRGSGGGPSGTWAGKLIGRKGYRPPGWTMPACGTDRGYYHHRSETEPACDPCKAAHAQVQRERVAAR